MDEKPASDRKSPGFWFYTADYERDVQILSLAAQGLWARMMCWMSDNEGHRGFCEAANGVPLPLDAIAAKVGRSKNEVKRCLAEMERYGIFSRDERGCIYSRRMARDTHISEVRKAAANSRHDTEKRAANGQFAGGFAPAKQDFAGAKHGANGMQKPSVTASSSVSSSLTAATAATALLPVELRPQTEYPETLRVIREHDAAADVRFCQRLADEVAREICSDEAASKWTIEKQRKAVSDPVIARCCREVYATPRKKPPGTGLLLSTVPRIVIGGKTNYV
jgi:hypothetical protein